MSTTAGPRRISPVRPPRDVEVYAEEERRAGQARTMTKLLSGRPVEALAAILVTVEAHARIEGISGLTLPFRPQAVAR